MKSIALFLLSASLVSMLSGAPVTANDGDDKAVRLIWFPRFSPDGKTLLSAHGSWEKTEAGEARLFNSKDGEVQRVITHPRGVRTVAWSYQGTFIVTGDYGGDVRTFDVKTGKLLKKITNKGNAENVRLSSDDKMLVVSYGSGDIRIFDLPDYQERITFRAAHKGGIWGMAISPDNQFIASGGQDRVVNIIDLKKNKIVFKLKHPNEVNGLAFTPDNKFLATGCADSIIRIYDVGMGEEVAMYEGHGRGTVTDLAFTSDGKILASAGGDGTIRIWNTSDIKNATLKKTLSGHTRMVFGVAISPDNRTVASVGWDEQVKMWDLKTGEEVWSWKR
ncbi:MAG TPA: WD40 repeat domain-containing protein [Gemmata sp.]|nr:WD40 repeat domain-containing protein [Gemmata sp.]